MKVTFYERQEDGTDRVYGAVLFRDGTLVTDPPDDPKLQEIINNSITVPGLILWPEHREKFFMRIMHIAFNTPEFRAGKIEREEGDPRPLDLNDPKDSGCYWLDLDDEEEYDPAELDDLPDDGLGDLEWDWDDEREEIEVLDGDDEDEDDDRPLPPTPEWMKRGPRLKRGQMELFDFD